MIGDMLVLAVNDHCFMYTFYVEMWKNLNVGSGSS